MSDKKYTEMNRSLMGGMKTLSMKSPDFAKNFQGLHHAAMQAGELDVATKELMALACGIVSQCETCIASHTAAAIRAGATEKAFFETLNVAVMMGGGSGLAYAAKAIEAYQELAG